MMFYATSASRLIGFCEDEHNCNACAGYEWCESTQACEKIWEVIHCD